MGGIKLKNLEEKPIIEEKIIEQKKAEPEVKTKPRVMRRPKNKDASILIQDASKTTEHTKHYLLNNGTAKTVVSGQEINYFDANTKEWKEVDSTFEDKGDVYESKSGKFKTRIVKAENGKKVQVSKSGKIISWEYIGKSGANEPVSTKLNVDVADNNLGKKSSSKAVYENIEKNTDIEYVLNATGVKENIVIKELSSDYRYSFALKTEGLKLRLSQDNESLELYSENICEDGKIETLVEFVIPSPYMYDAKGVSSDEVYYELDPKADGCYTFTVVASEEWINNENRVLPIVIDPQIITESFDLISSQAYQRNVYDSSSSGVNFGDWNATASDYIKIFRGDSYEFKTDLLIKKSKMNLLESSIGSVKLFLTPVSSNLGWICANGMINFCNLNDDGKVEIDITSQFKSSMGDFIVKLEAYDNNILNQFYKETYVPFLEIEYLVNENLIPTKKTLSLAGVANGELNLATGELVTSFCDVPAENSVMGLGVYHVNKRSTDDFCLGDNFRLNLNEKLEKHSDRDYVYTDAKGNKHGFRDYYYFIDSNGDKTYVDNKEEITVDANGELTFTDSDNNPHKIFCEFKSTTEIEAITILEGFKNNQYFEQRTEDSKKVETSFEEYKNALESFVRLNVTTGEIIDKLSNHELNIKNVENFKSNMSNEEILLPLNDAISYRSLFINKSMLEYQKNSYDLEERSIALQLSSIANKNGLCDEEMIYLDHQKTAFDNQISGIQHQITYYAALVEEGNLEQFEKTYYNAMSSNAGLQGTDAARQKGYLSVKQNEMTLQHGERLTQEKILVDQEENLTNIRNNSIKQLELYGQQMDKLIANKDNYLKQFENIFVEFISLKNQIEQIDRQQAVNFLKAEGIIKGFNKFGELCVVFDRHENYAVIEYEKYYDGLVEKSRISRLYDNNEKQVVFKYNSSNLLSMITDIYGLKTRFKYEDGKPKEVIFYDGKKVILSFDENDCIECVENTKTCLHSVITYDDFAPISIKTYADSIAEDKLLSQIGIDYELGSDSIISSVVLLNSKEQKREKYQFNGYGKLYQYLTEVDGVVVDAKLYEHTPYWVGDQKQTNPKYTVYHADKAYLYKDSLDTYAFMDKYNESTIINQFNKAERKVISARPIGSYLVGGVETINNVTSTIEYIYDDNQKLIEEIVTDTYLANPDKQIISHKVYTYNTFDEIIKMESFVEGEIYTNGKTIEETVYDDKGNVIKSFSYNSLDPSSKFYTENKVDDKGKVIAEMDSTGENATEYIYDDKNNVIGKKLANGSTLSYGLDESGETIAITQSTEEGIENSTQKHYENGKLLKVVSGNNTIEYTYNDKRYINSIKLNGQDYISGNPEEMVDENGIRVLETYSQGQIENEIYFSRKHISDDKPIFTGYCDATMDTYRLQYEYDERKNLKKITDTHNNEVTRTFDYTYNNLDQIKSYVEKEANTEKVNETITYNADGQIASKSVSTKDAVITQIHSYTYSDDSTKALASISSSGLTIYPKYDKLKRNKGKKAICYGATLFDENIVYKKVGDHATALPSVLCRTRYSTYDNSLSSYSATKYEYDNTGNIVKVFIDDALAIRYEYDALNRLVREDNKVLGKTYLFYYDNNGNITNKKEFAFTLKDRIELEELTCTTFAYRYDGDKLVKYNGQSIVYDAMYCPTTYKGKTLTWSNGRLTSYNGNTFTYDTLGRRVKKNNYDCFYDSEGKLIRYRDMQFIYDETGITGFHELGATFTFVKDVQGNVIELLAPNGEILAKYIYDAWGNCKVIDTNGYEITSDNYEGFRNPIRYRGYFYDVETGLYFLKTRYYDPETGRFISPDSIEYADPDSINGLNLYSYCANNPVSNVDPNGNDWWHWLLGIFAVVLLVGLTIISAGGASLGLMAIGCAANGVVMAGASTVTTILAFASVGAGITLVASGIVAGIGAIETWATGGSFSDGLHSISDYGETALYSTLSASIFSGLGGFLTYKEQIGNPSQNGHMSNSQRAAQRRAVWISKGNLDGKADYGMQISHIYGTFGNNRNYFVIQSASEHRAFHAIYGYKTAGGPFSRTNPYYSNFWEIIRRALGGI